MRKALRWILPLAAVPVLLLMAFGLTRDTYVLPSALIDRPAPPFSLETLGGDTVSLADYRGKVVLLNFWASWCTPCLAEHPVLVRATREFPSDSFAVLGVLYQDTPENGRAFMRRLGGEWPSVIDFDSRLAMDYGVYGVPESFFVSPDGRIVHKEVSALRWEIVERMYALLVSSGERLTSAEER